MVMQVPWKDDDELLAAWRDARTGFPWIDAIMVQVRLWKITFELEDFQVILQPQC